MTFDFVGLMGMLTQMTVRHQVPCDGFQQEHTKMFCVVRVAWRFLGMSSGCVAFIMAVERYFALAKPFFYCKHFTNGFMKRSLLIMWSSCAVLSFCPVFGVGIMPDELFYANKCRRYSDVNQPIDVVHAVICFFVGNLFPKLRLL